MNITLEQPQPETRKRKIYVFCNSCSNQWHVIVAIAEDGPCLASHLCSDHYFIRHDMGFTGDWKHESYDAHFGPGYWELELVERKDIKGHSGLTAALELNRQLGEAAKTKQEAA